MTAVNSARVRMDRDSRLHEQTVQAAARHARSFAARKGSARAHTVGGPVTETKVDPQVWKVALELAGGHPRRIEVVSAQVVVVHNHADWNRR